MILSGCAHPAATFRLVQTPHGALMVPPGVKDASVASASLRLSPRAGKRTCTASPHGLRIDGKRLIASREGLIASGSDELNAWIAALEAEGCVNAAEAFVMNARLIDAVPLDLAARHRLRGEGVAVKGFVDLAAAQALRVVSPVFRPGTAPGTNALASDAGKVSAGANGGLTVELKSSPDLAGYEIAWYDVRWRADGPGYRIVPRLAELHIAGQVEKAAAPQVNRFAFEPAARCFRFFVLTRSSNNDYDIVVLSAPTASELESRTKRFQKDAAGYLKSGDKSSYAAMTREIGVNPYVRVKLNGVETDVPLGDTIRQIIAATALPHLSVSLPHEGKMYPVKWDAGNQAILDLKLEGGEEIVTSEARPHVQPDNF